MSLDAAQHRSGKGSGDENFPVASWVVAKPHRRPILSFYEFVRIADDIADHATLPPDAEARASRPPGRKPARPRHRQPGRRDAARGAGRAQSRRRSTPRICSRRSARTSPSSATADWDDLIDYCRYSAMPVGRFVLDVHGESRATWPASDNVCAVLQIINHIQDCVKDYRSTRPRLYPAGCAQGRGLERRGARCAALDAATAGLPAWACRPYRDHAGRGRASARADQGHAAFARNRRHCDACAAFRRIAADARPVERKRPPWQTRGCGRGPLRGREGIVRPGFRRPSGAGAGWSQQNVSR